MSDSHPKMFCLLLPCGIHVCVAYVVDAADE